MSGEFYKQSFASRFHKMGDVAEAAFQERYPNAHRVGLDRTALNTRKMSARLRYAPDFMLEDGFYEVMGYASRGNNVLKVKGEKLRALLAWDLIAPTFLWARDSSKGHTQVARVSDWYEACERHGSIQFFPDNDKMYWELSPEDFPQ